MLAVETRDLTKAFGSRKAVDRLALAVPAGCVYGFLGPNGAGKTTTIRMLLGLLRPDGGAIRIMDHDLKTNRFRALSNLGSMVEGFSLYDHMSGRANLELTRSLLRLPKGEIDRVLDVVDLGHAAGRRVSGYSLGMRQRLALARALMGSPRLLLLDEPTNGLDPDGIIEMRNLIRELPGRIDGTVLLSSHILSEVEQMADFVGLINQGQLVLQGDIRAMIGETSSLLIELGDAHGAIEVLRSVGIEGALEVGGTIAIQVPNRNEARNVAASANRQLVDSGFEVYGLTARPRTLEDVYRTAVPNRSHVASVEGTAA